MALFAQEGDKLERPWPGSQPKAPEPMLAAQKLNSAVAMLKNKVHTSKDANEKAELQEKVKEVAERG